ncbi:MAG: DUF4921 family protein [bacterium]|nr:DUF4921 family protein [bacterium]MDZ4295967.1 DUF4921 family protein [Patescibacteria group bacterium]
MDSISELRQDLVSGDWVLIATGRGKRPHDFRVEKHGTLRQSPADCPFEDPQATGHGAPLLTLPEEGRWLVQAVPNKFPAVAHGECSVTHKHGPYAWWEGVGFHEVIIYRDHAKALADFSDEEIAMALEAFRQRYIAHREDDCIEYISLFHNHGTEAGASIAHPHSQIIAIPVIPPDVGRSLKGSRAYFEAQGSCVHCAILTFECETRERLIEETEHFVAFAPYASRTSFEVRIFPKKHTPSFRQTDPVELREAAILLRNVLKRLKTGLNDPALNFFIHTAPVRGEDFPYYHWHIEIIPKTAIWAGFELGTGIEISTIAPEGAAKHLKGVLLSRTQ